MKKSRGRKRFRVFISVIETWERCSSRWKVVGVRAEAEERLTKRRKKRKPKPSKIPMGPVVNRTGSGFHRDRRKRRPKDRERREIRNFLDSQS